MYKGSDCRQHIVLVLLKFLTDIERIQSEEFLLCGCKGCKVKLFSGGVTLSFLMTI